MPELGLATSRSLGAVAEPLLVGLAGLLLASVVAAADGGYFSDSWAWLAFVSLVVATLRLILVPALPLRRLDWAFVAGLGAFAAWVALSTLWAPAATPTIDETIRDVSYAAVVLALLLVVRKRTVEALLVGALAGVTLISALLAADPPASRLGRQLGPGPAVPALRADRLLERPRRLRGDGSAARSRPRRALGQPGRAGGWPARRRCCCCRRCCSRSAAARGSRSPWGSPRRSCSTRAGCSCSRPCWRSRPGPPLVLAARSALRPPHEEHDHAAAGGRRGRLAARVDRRPRDRAPALAAVVVPARWPRAGAPVGAVHGGESVAPSRPQPRSRRSRSSPCYGAPWTLANRAVDSFRAVPKQTGTDVDGPSLRPLLERPGRAVARLDRPVPGASAGR